jgi:hypothetical protein
MAKEPLRALILEDSEDDALLVVHELGRQGFEGPHEIPSFRLPTEGFVGIPVDFCENRIQAAPVSRAFLFFVIQGLCLVVHHCLFTVHVSQGVV